jgi:nitrite reductase/ring-hydroxylating ferredoxin subunit
MSTEPELAGAWHALVPFAELPDDDTGRSLEVGGRRVACFRQGERVHALDDACPHRGASLGDGVVREGQVTCPWHSFHFDLGDGRNADGLPLAAAVHPTRVRPDGMVEVRLPG